MQPADSEIAQLQAALAALEAQRSLLGDAVVDTAIGPIQTRLAALRARAQSGQQRKQATVLFADASGFTALSEMMDAEVVAAIMNDLWLLVDKAITDHGGRIDKHIGDAVMALWGAESAREDDPEMAVRAALGMQAAVDEFCRSHNAPLALRIGINTGQVLLGAVGSMGEFTAMGDAVNMASRLEHAAPVGGVLLAHDTYRHVRGIFDVQAQEPLVVKGKAQPVQTYIVLRAKPRAFRMATRGVEGVETRMVGRDAELEALREAFAEAIGSSQTRVVTVVGEAGVGKSRLLYEFDNWIELRPEEIIYFKGRSIPNTQHVPYSLFRDLFALRFDILDSDSSAVALDKFRAGMAGVLAADHAAIVGHWLGFDFSANEAVGRLLGTPGFAQAAQAYLMRYFRRVVAEGPAVILLEDIHWADDLSLDLAQSLVTTLPAAPLLVVALARPVFFEHRRSWGENDAAFRFIRLTPLSKAAAQALVDEILQRADTVPGSLRDLIVASAEGNPFYVEELVKMLIEQGVIERDVVGAGLSPAPTHDAPAPTGGQDVWRVRADKLAGLKVPATLTSLLQARLDSLPRREREALQRAAVIGRLFWDDCVADLLEIEREAVEPTLDAIRRRELIFHHEHPTFRRADEYVFKHALLRDVTYETVLLKYRTEFHRKVAHWLEENAGERIGEYLGVIAEHFAQAGEFDRAAGYQQQAGEQALRAAAFRPARVAFERALALRQRGQAAPGASLASFLKMGEVCYRLSDFPAAAEALERALALARDGGDIQAQTEALSWLALVAISVGRVDAAGGLLEEALTLARQVGGATLAQVLIHAANHYWQQGDLDAAGAYADEAHRLSYDLDNVSLQSGATRTLGVIAGLRGDFGTSIHHFEICIDLARQIGDRVQESKSQANLGATKQYAGDTAGAVNHYRAAFEVDQELGMTEMMALDAHNLADAYNMLGQLDEGRRFAVECIRLAQQVGATPLQLAALVPLAEVLLREGETGRALALLGLARSHPSTPHQKQSGIQQALATVTLAPAEVEAGLAAGAALSLEGVVPEILDGKW